MTRTLSDLALHEVQQSGTDCTVIRPRPEQRRARAIAAGPQTEGSARRDAGAYFRSPGDLDQLRSSLASNQLLSEASALLALASHIRAALHRSNPADLRRQLVAEVQRFEEAAHQCGFAIDRVHIASYWLCALLDDAVLQTPWGSQCNWQRHALSVRFHQARIGNGNPLTLLDQLVKAHSPDLSLLEFCYVCLSIGFEGRFSGIRNQVAVDALRADLYRAISQDQRAAPVALCEHWQGLRSHKKRYRVPVWVLASLFVALTSVSCSALNYWVVKQSEPVVRQLQGMDSADKVPRRP